jgi:hypothetical protein
MCKKFVIMMITITKMATTNFNRKDVILWRVFMFMFHVFVTSFHIC